MNIIRTPRRVIRRRAPNAGHVTLGAALAAAGFALLCLVVRGCFDVPTHTNPQELAMTLLLLGMIGAGLFCFGAYGVITGLRGEVR